MSSYKSQIERADVLIEALPFLQRYRGNTFVIKYGGSAMEDDHIVDRLLRDVVFLEAVGINPVLLHGGGKAITGRMREAGIKPQFVNGLRITDERAIRIVEETLDGIINPRIVNTINELGGRACGFSGKTIFRADKIPPQVVGKQSVDLGFVGAVTGFDLTEVEKAIAEETVPVISPIARAPDESVLNVNADVAAGSVAGELKAAKLIYLSDVLGIMRDQGSRDSLIPSVNRQMIEKLIKEEIISGGMLPKVESAVKALTSGVGKVHFIDGRIPHSVLLEIFTNAGIGTEIVP
jgi:acetylglutamate kinase